MATVSMCRSEGGTQVVLGLSTDRRPDSMLWGGLAVLLGLMVVGAGQGGGWRRAGLLALGLVVIAGLVVAQSLGFSWFIDYPAQGRYLFPGIPLVLLAGVLLCPRVPVAGAFWTLWLAALPVAWWAASVASAAIAP